MVKVFTALPCTVTLQVKSYQQPYQPCGSAHLRIGSETSQPRGIMRLHAKVGCMPSVRWVGASLPAMQHLEF